VSDATRVAGIAGTLTYALTSNGQPVVPASAPVTTIYSDLAMTIVAVAAATDAAGSASNAFLIAYPASLAIGTYYLKTVTTISAGNVLTDVDDRLILVPVTGSVSSSLATLDEFKAHLNLKGVTTTDAELQGFLDAATPVIENICGPILTRTVTAEKHDGGEGFRISLVVRQRPILAVSSVTEYAGDVATVLTQVTDPSAGTDFSYTVDLETGTITRRGSSGGVIPFYGGVDNILVTYTAGYATVPLNVRLAALFQAAHMFQSSQLSGRLLVRGVGEDSYSFAAGFGIPNRVRELLQPHQRIPGIA